MKYTKLKILKKIYAWKVCLIALSLAFASTIAYSVPAKNEFCEIIQPDNSKIIVKIQGDEKVNWLESKEGYTLLRNNEKYVVYATQDANGNLIPSNYKYYATTKQLNSMQNAELQNFLANTPKKMRYSNSQIETMLQVWKTKNYIQNKLENEFQNSNAVAGTRKYLVILMSYKDLKFTKTKEEYNDIFNKENYQGAAGIGSVRDYFYQNSYGKFTPEFTIAGPYTANNNMAYYRDRGRELAREAVRQVYFEETINFADFDNTKNGMVDAVTIIFAGYGRENGTPDAIWSHASITIDNINDTPPFYDGKEILRYCCFPELRGNSGNIISAIGVACHEFTHTLGAPDYYDTDYGTNGQYTGAGDWCLMASGCWNGWGTTPSHINIFQKTMLGWVEPEILSTVNKAVIDMPNSAEHPVAYQIPTNTNNEFFILENKQRVGFDRLLPGSGLLIWHVHSEFDATYNCVNCTHPQKMYPVCASSNFATPTVEPASYGNINSAGCPFPGSTDNTSFTDNSTPSARSWRGTNNYRPITNITENNLLISFNFTGRPDAIFNIPYSYNFTDALHYSFYTTINAGSDNVRVWRRTSESNGNWYASVLGMRNFTTELNNAWLITPPFSMFSGRNYKLTFQVRARAVENPEALAVYIGTGNTIEAQTQKLLDLPEIANNTYQAFSVDFTVPDADLYYIGFHCYSGADKWELYLDNISINAFVSVEESEVVSLVSVYPNPTDGQLIIANNDDVFIERIDISDISGRILISTEARDIRSIDLSSLNPGTYWIIFHTSKGIELKPIIKQP